jgi:hypothetical protein
VGSIRPNPTIPKITDKTVALLKIILAHIINRNPITIRPVLFIVKGFVSSILLESSNRSNYAKEDGNCRNFFHKNNRKKAEKEY